ncbi:MAG: anhydro-N-acetylmuramic acid kinase [Candidatus Magnetobacterium sp. LHC-1]|nr:anhydro-N-acetylmuramic acid kinase [Nitrospirota bacterium]
MTETDPMRIIGLMSGTSHDGVDAAIVEIRDVGDSDLDIEVSVRRHLHMPYDNSLRDSIRKAFSGTVEHICNLNFLMGEVFAQVALLLIQEAGLDVGDIDAIASHGQTVYHIPPSTLHKRGSTLQIGEAAVIAERTGILTISDFRTRDMAAGGHGAPLVPLADYILFKKGGSTRAVLNVGGIANATIVKDTLTDTLAFDIGPGNCLIDEAVVIYSDGAASFDKNGSMASSGTPHLPLLEELLRHPFFKQPPPKSTGREMFGAELVRGIIKRNDTLTQNDMLSTLTHLTAQSIFDAIRPYKPQEVIVSGGGSRNASLMALLTEQFNKKGCKVGSISSYGFLPEAKEAVCFAILGYMTLKHRPGNLPSATGASRPVLLGKITLP